MASTSAMPPGRPKLDEVTCPEHPDATMIEDYRAGDMVCSMCGKVVVERCIDVSSEWRSFADSGEDKSRVGEVENHLLTGSGLGTVAERTSHLSHNDQFDYSRQTMVRAQNTADRTLTAGYREITTMADRINLQETIITRAKTCYKQLIESGKYRGKNRIAVAASCIHIACRQEGVPRSFKETVAISNVDKTELGRTYKKVLKALESSVEIIKSGDFMARFCGSLELPHSVRKASEHIANKAVELNIVAGRSPVSVAAAAIYLASHASDFPKSKEQIAAISGAAEVTIKQSYKMLLPHVKILFPENTNNVTWNLNDLPSQ
ncbi:transcription initiation factor IIB-like [Symsagittifera roscoffensis]|uniref:transcription initiation factor IIB-like n=1 Tax=Symsagittifera roscoffensis TaxID=84072 RepID=UPI00307B77B9